MFKRTCLALLAALSISSAVFAQDEPNQPAGDARMPPVETGYAAVNDLSMYYEIYGAGEPLIVLHGAYMSIPIMSEFIQQFAQSRQVIAVELQGHGRTADADRPLSYEQMADDVAAMMQEIGIAQADFFGYSLGGGVALQVAIRHPAMAGRLAVASMPFNTDGYHPGMIDMIQTITPEMFAGSPIEESYVSLAPNPDDFPTLVEKLVQLDSEIQDWSPESIQAIESPTLLIFGDSDIVRLEHVVEMFQLRGGNVNGDLAGLPSAQLAVIPGATHTSVLNQVDLLAPIITAFLNAPAAE